nr:MAG TPA: hypothetical protein [Caudoviricetes sp.]
MSIARDADLSPPHQLKMIDNRGGIWYSAPIRERRSIHYDVSC